MKTSHRRMHVAHGKAAICESQKIFQSLRLISIRVAQFRKREKIFSKQRTIYYRREIDSSQSAQRQSRSTWRARAREIPGARDLKKIPARALKNFQVARAPRRARRAAPCRAVPCRAVPCRAAPRRAAPRRAAPAPAPAPAPRLPTRSLTRVRTRLRSRLRPRRRVRLRHGASVRGST